MFRLEGGRPGDARGFLHKSFIGRAVGKAVTTFVPAVGIARDVVGTARRVFGRAPARPVAPRTTTARPTLAGAQGKELGRDLKFGGVDPGFRVRPMISPITFAPAETPCRPGFQRDPATGRCLRPTPGIIGRGQRFIPGGATGFEPAAERTPVGDAVMGRYGAALEPGVMVIERSVCLPGMNLGDDGLCYNKGAITNKQRQWPRGRRPLLTGGDMRAIGIAARAGSKLDRTTKRLRSLGMMKALPKGRGGAAPRAHAHAKPAAAVSV